MSHLAETYMFCAMAGLTVSVRPQDRITEFAKNPDRDQSERLLAHICLQRSEESADSVRLQFYCVADEADE